MVRAKFCLSEIKIVRGSRFNEEKKVYESQPSYTLIFFPVTGTSEENKKFFQSTPGGTLVLGGLNKDVSDQFELGKEYYADFSIAN